MGKSTVHKAYTGQTWANPKQDHIWDAYIEPMWVSNGQTDTYAMYTWVAHMKPMLDTHGQNEHMGSPPKAYVRPIRNSPQHSYAQLSYVKPTWATRTIRMTSGSILGGPEG